MSERPSVQVTITLHPTQVDVLNAWVAGNEDGLSLEQRVAYAVEQLCREAFRDYEQEQLKGFDPMSALVTPRRR